MGTSGSLLRRFDDAFSRTFTAMAMAEDGTRALALEMLEGPGPDDGDDLGDEADSDHGDAADPLAHSA